MNEEIKLQHEIDRYLNGEMNAQEKAALEILRRQDAGFDRQVKEQQYFLQMLNQYHDRRWIQHHLFSLQNADEKENISPAKTFSLKHHFLATIAVAASIALVVAVGCLWVSHTMTQEKTKHGYVDLRRAIVDIQRSQNAIMHDIHQSAKAPVNPGTFGGSGFAISSDGYIATNFHVINNADSVYVQNDKGEAFKADVVYQDAATDLAILKIDDDNFKSLPALPYSLTTAPAELGEEVYTLGFPKDEVVYGKGYISSETGFHGDTTAYQLSIPVNPGNSGGPLLNSKGNIIGIISGKQGSSEDVAFAVKSDFLMPMLDSLPDDFNEHILMNAKKPAPASRLNRVDQIHKLQDYVFLIKAYN